MELRQLRYFLKAKELLNFTAAAEALNISQSTLSQQIKQLEIELGIPLFNRVGKRISLTEAALVFSTYAAKSLKRANEGQLAMQDLLKLQRGSLRLGVSYGLRPTLIKALKSFSKKHPKITITISFGMTSAIIEDLEKSNLDLVLCFEEDHPGTQLAYTPLFVSKMGLVCAADSSIATQDSIKFSAIKELPLALLPMGYSTSFFIRERLRKAGWDSNLALEINDTPTLLEMTRTGNWFTFLTQSTAEHETGVTCVPINETAVTRTASLVAQKDSYRSAAMQAFQKELLLS